MSREAEEQNDCMDSPAGYGINYPSYVVSDTTTYQGNYLSSPVTDSLEWPNDLNDACATSPLSSSGLSTPQDVESQNYFERSFSAALQPGSLTISASGAHSENSVSYQQSDPLPDWNPDGTGGISSGVPSYVPLPPYALANDDDIDITERQAMYQCSSPSAYSDEKPPETTFNSAWGSLKESRGHSSTSQSNAERRSSRSKRKTTQEQCKGSSFSSIPKWSQLRSTRAEKKIKFDENKEKEKMETNNTRTSHNMVEKKYRTRLNAQFSTLLEALPPELVGAEVDVYGRNGSGAEKKISKADVLVLARRRIEHLEREKRKLEGANHTLLQNMQRLKGEWVGMGGPGIALMLSKTEHDNPRLETKRKHIYTSDRVWEFLLGAERIRN